MGGPGLAYLVRITGHSKQMREGWVKLLASVFAEDVGLPWLLRLSLRLVTS